jgi:hypothetical protein
MPDALRVRVIGGLTVDGIAEHTLGSRKARMALRILGITHGRPVTIERRGGRCTIGAWQDRLTLQASPFRGTSMRRRSPCRTIAALVTGWARRVPSYTTACTTLRTGGAGRSTTVVAAT